MTARLAKLLQALRPTPARVYNASVLLGLVLVGAGVADMRGRAEMLAIVGALVLALAIFERVLLFTRGRR